MFFYIFFLIHTKTFQDLSTKHYQGNKEILQKIARESLKEKKKENSNNLVKNNTKSKSYPSNLTSNVLLSHFKFSIKMKNNYT